MIQCTTQAAAEMALKADPNAEIEMVKGEFKLSIGNTDSPWLIVNAGVSLNVVAWGSSQPRVVAWGSSQLRVEARESSRPRVVAWGSSQPRVEAWESSRPRVVARGSSQPRVVAWESSRPRVVAWGSSQPRVVAWESSRPRVEAWESSQPRVVARGFVQLSLLGKVIAKATASVSVLIDGPAKVTGGRQVTVKRGTPKQWCDYYGVAVKAGIATLFKAVDDNFMSPHGGNYTPGTAPVAEYWDGGKKECGGGLHFSPSPVMARSFNPKATRYVACSVRLKDMVVHPNGYYPEKIKAKGCCTPTWEVDEDGETVEQAETEKTDKE